LVLWLNRHLVRLQYTAVSYKAPKVPGTDRISMFRLNLAVKIPIIVQTSPRVPPNLLPSGDQGMLPWHSSSWVINLMVHIHVTSEMNNMWCCTFTAPYVFMWCLNMMQGQFYRLLLLLKYMTAITYTVSLYKWWGSKVKYVCISYSGKSWSGGHS
jgi:hypothetical protein